MGRLARPEWKKGRTAVMAEKSLKMEIAVNANEKLEKYEIQMKNLDFLFESAYNNYGDWFFETDFY